MLQDEAFIVVSVGFGLSHLFKPLRRFLERDRNIDDVGNVGIGTDENQVRTGCEALQEFSVFPDGCVAVYFALVIQEIKYFVVATHVQSLVSWTTVQNV